MVTFSVFWLFSALYLFVDFTGRPKWALQYKIQDGSNQPVSYLSSHNFLGVSNGKFRTSWDDNSDIFSGSLRPSQPCKRNLDSDKAPCFPLLVTVVYSSQANATNSFITCCLTKLTLFLAWWTLISSLINSRSVIILWANKVHVTGAPYLRSIKLKHVGCHMIVCPI